MTLGGLQSRSSCAVRLTTLMLVASIAALAQTASPEASVRQCPETIAKVRQDWQHAWESRDLKLLMKLYDANAVRLTPIRDRIIGRSSIETHFGETFAAASSLSIELKSENCEFSGALAYDSGTYERTDVHAGGGAQTITGGGGLTGSFRTGPSGEKTETSGNYLVVLKRDRQNWLIVQHSVN